MPPIDQTLCPFCLNQSRGLGGIALVTPEQLVRGDSGEPILGGCCVDCLAIIALTLDGLRNGRINSLAEKYQQSGVLPARNGAR